MKSLHKQTAKSPGILAKSLFKLERLGKYNEALAEIRDIWEDISASPKIEEFEPRDAADILLRCGSLIGFHGHIEQVPHAQQRSKDLLTEAHTRFLKIGDIEKIAECENYLALAYWRTGEINEAQSWIHESKSHNLPNSSEVTLYSRIIESKIDFAYKNYKKICRDFAELEIDFSLLGDDFLTGNLFNNYGLALKNLGRECESLAALEISKDLYYKSGNKVHYGLAENNLAQLYKAEGRFNKAHSSIDSAAKLFKQIKDKTREGFSLDTKAQIYFAEARYEEALETVEKAIKILAKSENSTYLVETLLTKAKILLYLDDFSAAIMSLLDAVDIARVQAGEEFAKSLIRDFELALNEKNSPKPAARVLDNPSLEDVDLKLVLPPSIAHYDDYQGVRITNSHLEDIGLKPGSLAIVVDERVKRGDLAAICEIEDDSVSCGFYDSDFGIVCLEGVNSEPILFDEKKVKLIGKIVGFCNSEADADGNLIVEPINA